ncbi:hypothetical protein Aeqsu_2023 [Aequorivita sublithincola DSM 14238]|uniref:DUF4369 domain-containing protein n=1 Tax=Aequorivita sublithincola (strain DSM 14238 / LMG 21431 / ACAM 643 / 9-3) TaxID=746697 RepID=I3YWX1_AEQSU|nr:DUF4369 domain-containing protein [Aequorivita sublithincola]AFL81489.1 hypothetical protein Aeqsu_2023 [Aequorivita sublithincola DSM 14238]
MRYFLKITIVFLSLIGCSTDTEMMNLTGNVKGLKKGTLLLQKFEDTVLVTIDSLIVDGNSNFSFSKKIESPEIYYLYVRLKDGTMRDDRIAFFAENAELNIKTNLKNFGSAAKVTGSKNDSVLKEYLKLKDRYIIKNLSLIEERLKVDSKNVDSSLMKIDQKQRALLTSKYLATINFAMNHKDQEVAPYLMLSEVYDSNIKYLDTVYNALSPKIKNSKYGTELESFIVNRKKADTIL